ncbi:hypothetical protein ACFWXH_19455 [Mesorhizobium sp. NPDC059054]|uniref:hypothetical protein n=1 Tax=Mesorhizobium sp. NPDC059054 TaxID=3346711 RepID=UPI003681DFC1
MNESQQQQADIEKHFRLFQQQLNRFGYSRSPLQLDFDGKRMVVAGPAIYRVPLQWNFREFLLSYGLGIIGRAVVDAEPDKQAPQHPLAKQLVAARMVTTEEAGASKLIGMNCELDAFIHLSWDLFTVADNVGIQTTLIERLKKPLLYQGARYEVFVTASFLRAGFSIEFEREDDPTRTHCEFTATSKKTGKLFSVEAKSRHRANHDNKQAGLSRLLKKALTKSADHERITFVDVNLPHDTGELFQVAWHREVGAMLTEMEARQDPRHPWPQSFLFFTNGTFSLGHTPNGRVSTMIVTAINHPLFQQTDRRLVESAYPEVGKLCHAVDHLGEPPKDFPGEGTGFNKV